METKGQEVAQRRWRERCVRRDMRGQGRPDLRPSGSEVSQEVSSMGDSERDFPESILEALILSNSPVAVRL